MKLKIYIENKVIDLFGDEGIEMNSSIANTEDITKINTDYTKTFTVPATDRNNALFKHYYNADIDNTFDARTKKDCRIELNGFPFRSGKMRLEKVNVKSNRPHAYTINFWGNLVNFKDLLKEDELSSLDFSQYNHPYTFTSAYTGLTTGLFDKNIIYTLISQRRQFMYNSDPSDNTNTSQLVNIAYNGQPRGILWNDLMPSIRLLAIIEAIEAKYGFVFSRDFFSRIEFKELYMWLNSDAGVWTEQEINWNSGDADQVGLNYNTNAWVRNSYLPYYGFKYRVRVTPASGFFATPYKIICKKDGEIDREIEATGEYIDEITDSPIPPFSYKFYVSCASTFSYTAALEIQPLSIPPNVYNAGASLNTIVDEITISDSMPKLKIIDFLKGLFNAFKLVAVPESDGKVYINNIDDYYKAGEVYDITKWVESDNFDVKRGNIYNTIKFKFQEATTILNKQFKLNTGVAYGDEELSLADADGVPLDGGTLEVTLPFEQILFERLSDIEDNRLTGVNYGLAVNEELKPVNPKPVIYYNSPVSHAVKPISLITDTNTSLQIDFFINTPSHSLGFDNPAFVFLWGVEFSTWNSVAMPNTLFANYWDSYVTSIFNVKKREFNFKANLPTWLLTKINLNDILYIKERYYRINDFTIDLTTGSASFNLINTFENNFGLFKPSQNRISLTSQAQTYEVYVSNSQVMNFEKEDIGYGVAWATLSHVGSNIVIAVSDNTSGDFRGMYLNVDNGAGKSFQIFLSQD